jgi:hypothetical protein
VRLVDEDVERRDATVEERQETTVLPALIVLVIGVLGAEVGGPALGEHLLTEGGDAGVGDGVDPAAQVALPNGIGQQVGGDGGGVADVVKSTQIGHGCCPLVLKTRPWLVNPSIQRVSSPKATHQWAAKGCPRAS